MGLFENDGCTLFPDGAWVACCSVHDEGFATGKTVDEFLKANADLFGCMAQYNWLAASIAFLGVMTGGALFYFLGRKRPPGPLPSVIIANPFTASHSRGLFSASEKTMATQRGFDRALPHILVHEGGKVDHPKDPGGRTNKGITQRVYNAWRGKSNLPIRDVYLIDAMEVAAIYRFQYWDAVMGDRLPEGVGYVVFDGATNSGPKQSIKWLQRALGSLYTGTVDGVMGTVTLDAVFAVTDLDALIARIIDRRETFLRALKTWPTFGKGWQRRIDQVEKTGQAWATGSIGPQSTFVGGNEKAPIEAAKAAPGKGVADAAAGAGGGAGGIAVVLEQTKEALTPYSASSGWITNLVVALVIAGAVLAIGGFAYRWYAGKQKAKLNDALDPDPVAA